jgi:hypothetical protein
MDIHQEQICRLCGGKFTVGGILELADFYWPRIDVLVCKSPCCEKTEELQLADGQIERGYVYAAGAPHFAGMELYKVPGLRVVKSSRAIKYTVSGAKFTVNAKP